MSQHFWGNLRILGGNFTLKGEALQYILYSDLRVLGKSVDLLNIFLTLDQEYNFALSFD